MARFFLFAALLPFAAHGAELDPLVTRWTFGAHEPYTMYRRVGRHCTGGIDGNALWVKEWLDWFDAEAPAKMQEIGLNFIHSRFYKGMGWEIEKRDFPNVKRFVANCHAHGVKTLAYVQFNTLYPEAMRYEIPDIDSWASIGMDGQKNEYNCIWGGNGNYFRWAPCLNCREWVEYVKRICTIALTEGGFDGIMFDNLIDYPCYCKRCEAAFRERLCRIPDPTVRFGFDDLSSIMLPHIPAARLRDMDVKDPVVQEWALFRCDTINAVSKELVAHIKNIKPDAIVSGNASPYRARARYMPAAHNMAELCRPFDFMLMQNDNFPDVTAGGVIVNRVRDLKFAQDLGQRIVALCDADAMISGRREANFLTAMMEDVVFGGIPTDRTVISPTPDPGFVDRARFERRKRVHKTFNAFVSSHATALSSPTIHSVRIFYPERELLFSYRTNQGIAATEEIFLRNRVPYGYLIAYPDEPITVPPDTEVIVVPGLESLSDAQIAFLAEWARKGGRLVVTGDSGRYDEWNAQRRENPLLAKIAGLPNVVLRKDADILPGGVACDWATLAPPPADGGKTLMNALAATGWKPLVRFENLPPHVFAEYRRLPSGDLAVHLVNYMPMQQVKGGRFQLEDGGSVEFEQPFGERPAKTKIGANGILPSFGLYAILTLKKGDVAASRKLNADGATAWPGGRDFTVYNVVPYSPGHEAQAAADAVELKERTGIDIALYCLSLHPVGNPPINNARRYIESFRAFKRELEGEGIHIGVLVQSILGHSWARVAAMDDSWTAAVDCNGKTKRFCSASPGFAAYITEVISMLARENPAFILTDDDVRAFSHDAECFCARHVALFNSRRGTSYTSEELREKLASARQDDSDHLAFCTMQREMQENLGRRIRAAIDSVDASIPGGICIARTEQRFCAMHARTMAAKGQTPLMRAATGSYLERMSAANAPNTACRMMGFAEYYKDYGIDIICESDTCPHNQWSKSSRSLMTHMATAAFAGMKGAKTWYLNGHKGKFAVTRSYTDELARNRGFLPALAAEVKGSRWEGIASPCFTNFPAWHVVTNQFDFFVETESAAGALFPVLGIPYRVSREFDEDGIYALESAAEVARLSDDDLRRMFSRKVVVFGPAVLAIAKRGLCALTGVKAEERDLFFTCEHDNALDVDMGASMKDGTVAFDVLPGAQVLSSLGSRPFYGSSQYVPATAAAVLYDNTLGGKSLSLQYHFGVSAFCQYSEARRASLLGMLGKLNGGPLPFTLAHDQDITVLVRRREDGTRILFVENLNADPVACLVLNVPAGDWRVERLCGDGAWRSVKAERDGTGRIVCDVGVDFYEAVVLRMF